jgi:2-methyl-3-hydroxypyridine 5-carboxylic acid dioxygenase
MGTRRHAEIAGAGFAGLTAGIALSQRGWSVRIHETSSALREFGAGIFIWDNGILVLKAIDAYDDIIRTANDARYFETRYNGSTISKIPFGPGTGQHMLTLTRQDLYAGILASARRHGVDILTSSTVTGATPDGGLQTADGRTFTADMVIGADGVKSAVRESLKMPTERRIFDDGVIRLLAGRQELVGGDWDNVIDFWGPDEKSLRILYGPCNPAEVYLCMLAPRDHPTGAAVPVNKAAWIDAIPELTPILQSLDDQGRYDPYEMTRVKSWSAGSVALVGDSANGMPPTLGQGAGCAMMNALSLAVATETTSSIPDALVSWERHERWLTDETQQKACNIAEGRKLKEGHTFAQGSDALATARHIPTGTSKLVVA